MTPRKPKQTTELEYISPAKATEYLKQNTVNRKKRPRKIDRFIRALKEGKFQTTHQGIGFNCDGTLLDGQHRLDAIATSGIGAWMNVTKRLPREVIYATDQGTIRTPMDILGPLGVGHSDEMTPSHVATSRAMAAGRHPGVLGRNLGTNTVCDWTNEDVVKYVSHHFDAIDFACSLSLGDFRSATIRAVIARAWYTQDRERLTEFAEVLRTGVVNHRTDVAAVAFRNYYLTSPRGAGSSFIRAEHYRKCQGSLVEFLAKNPLSKLREFDDEKFLVPGEDS